MRELHPLTQKVIEILARLVAAGVIVMLGMALSLSVLLVSVARGVVEDRAEAVKWIERAAAQGHADASAYLQGHTKR